MRGRGRRWLDEGVTVRPGSVTARSQNGTQGLTQIRL